MRTFKIILNVIKWILFALVAVVLVNNVYTIIRRTAYNDKMPTFLGFSSAVVVSGSMEPEININDVVLAHKRSEYKVGDIIVFHDVKNDDYITHRIKEVTSNGYRTKGDNNDSYDIDLVKKENVVGAVYCVLPQFGVVSSFISTPMGAFCLILLVFVIIFVPDIILSLFEKNKDKSEEKQKEAQKTEENS